MLDSLGGGMGDGLLLPPPPAGAYAWNPVSKNIKISEKSPLFAYCLAPNFLLIYRESFSINLATYLGYVFISYIHPLTSYIQQNSSMQIKKITSTLHFETLCGTKVLFGKV